MPWEDDFHKFSSLFFLLATLPLFSESLFGSMFRIRLPFIISLVLTPNWRACERCDRRIYFQLLIYNTPMSGDYLGLNTVMFTISIRKGKESAKK